jgi:hypothetical protein
VARRAFCRSHGDAMQIIGAFDQERRASGTSPREWVERARTRARSQGEVRENDIVVADVISRMLARQAMHDRMAYRTMYFESGSDVNSFSSLTPGPDADSVSGVRPRFEEGRAAAPPQAACGGPPQAAVAAISDGDGGREAGDDWRVAIHEGSHCLSGPILFGVDSLGGATIVQSATFGGLCWGPRNSAALGLTGGVSIDLCDQMRAAMPADGEPILGGSEIHAHVRGRVVDLLSGSEGERLLCDDGPPWPAESDLEQARNLASIVCSSAETVELFLSYCRAEAAALVAKHRASIQAVATALIEHRTMAGAEIIAVVAECVSREALAVERLR